MIWLLVKGLLNHGPRFFCSFRVAFLFSLDYFIMDQDAEIYFSEIVKDIRSEREYQWRRWGSSFDEKNTPNDWLAYILGYAGAALTLPWDHIKFRRMLVKTAGICFAAIEWCDRTEGKMPKRHYD